MNGHEDTRPPRGALAVVAVGLLATLAAALLATDKSAGSAAQLEWVQQARLPGSPPAAVPGGRASIRLADGDIRATGTNFSGYSLYRVASTLRIDAGAPAGSSRIACETRAPRDTEVARTPKIRAIYPRSSDKLRKQETPDTSLLRFSANGAEYSVVEMDDLFPRGFAQIEGVKLEWPEYEPGVERLRWFLPPGRLEQPLELPFASLWKSTAVPAARIACTIATSAGEATVRTAGELPDRSPPINEEEEEERREEEAAENESED